MKIETYKYPHSSFLSVEKDMDIIINAIMKNNRLKKLLYYTTEDCLSRTNLTEDQTLEMFGKNIKIIPRLHTDQSILNYLIISFDTFTPNATNPQFRDNLIQFDIICHYDQWQLQDFQLRPYKIAAELDTIFTNTRLTGIGELEFIGAHRLSLPNNFAGLCVTYTAIHGDEDKINPLNPADKKALNENFNEVYNN